MAASQRSTKETDTVPDKCKWLGTQSCEAVLAVCVLRDPQRLDQFGPVARALPYRDWPPVSGEPDRRGAAGAVHRTRVPEAYFDSLDGLYLDDDFQYALPRGRYWRRHPLSWLKTQTISLVRFPYLYRRLTHDILDSRLRQCYRTRLRGAVRRRPDPDMLLVYAIKCGMHYHHHTMATQMARRETDVVNSF